MKAKRGDMSQFEVRNIYGLAISDERGCYYRVFSDEASAREAFMYEAESAANLYAEKSGKEPMIYDYLESSYRVVRNDDYDSFFIAKRDFRIYNGAEVRPFEYLDLPVFNNTVYVVQFFWSFSGNNELYIFASREQRAEKVYDFVNQFSPLEDEEEGRKRREEITKILDEDTQNLFAIGDDMDQVLINTGTHIL